MTGRFTHLLRLELLASFRGGFGYGDGWEWYGSCGVGGWESVGTTWGGEGGSYVYILGYAILDLGLENTKIQPQAQSQHRLIGIFLTKTSAT